MDDLRPIGVSKEKFWVVSHALASRYSYLSMQISTWKTGPPSQHSGARAGSHIIINDHSIGITCGLQKWQKAQHILRELLQDVEQNKALHHKTLEQKHGFLVCLQGTYLCITPFLRGIHLTPDSWHEGHDLDSCKFSRDRATESHFFSKTATWSMAALEFVQPVTHLHDYLHCLNALFASEHPPI